MKATFQRTELLAALKTVGAACPTRGGQLPILTGVKIDVDGAQATLACTDLERAVTTVVPCSLDSTAGTAVVPHGTLTRVLGGFRAAEVTVDVDPDGHQVVLTCGRAAGTLNVLPPAEWPRAAVVDGDTVKLGLLDVDVIRRVLVAVGTDDARPILTGVHFDGNEVACTDSYRLAVGKLRVECPQMLVPGKFLSAVLRDSNGDLTCTTDERGVAFTCGDTTWTSRLIQGEYAQYRTLLPNPKATRHRLSIDRDDLLEALAAVGTIGAPVEKDKHWEPVHVMFDGDDATFRITQHGVGVTEATVEAGGDWPEKGVGFNPHFLADLVACMCEMEVIDLDAVDGLKPSSCDDGTVTTVLMPVRIQGVTA